MCDKNEVQSALGKLTMVLMIAFPKPDEVFLKALMTMVQCFRTMFSPEQRAELDRYSEEQRALFEQQESNHNVSQFWPN